MYSTIDGAKALSKTLKKLFDRNGIIYPLHRCQAAVASAGGFRDWDNLGRTIGMSDRLANPVVFRRRLLAALPEPCWLAVLTWLGRGKLPELTPDGAFSTEYYDSVFPYVSALSAIHRSRSAVLRPGSGQGQRMREALVMGVLLGGRTSFDIVFRLEPETLTLVAAGELHELFEDDIDHPRFAIEFATLTAAGIFEHDGAVLRVRPPDRVAVAAHVAEGNAGRAQHYREIRSSRAAEAVGTAFAAAGIANSARLTKALVSRSSRTHDAPAAALQLLSDLGEAGELGAVSRLWNLLSVVDPVSGDTIRRNLPARMSSMFFEKNRGIDASEILRWTAENPGWADELEAALPDPVAFEESMLSMSEDLLASDTRARPDNVIHLRR